MAKTDKKTNPAGKKATPAAAKKTAAKAPKAVSTEPKGAAAKAAPATQVSTGKAAGKATVKAAAKPAAAKPGADKTASTPVTAKPSAPAAPKAAKPTAPKPTARTSKATPSQASAPAATPSRAATPVAAPPTPSTVAAAPGKRKRAPSGPRVAVAPSMDTSAMVASSAAKASFLPNQEPEMMTPTATPAQKDPKLATAWKKKALEDLTDADVLSMPESEYMNDVQMAYFRAKLVTLKNDILTNADETTEHLREDTVVVPDPADRATIEEEHALELRTRDRERKLLKKIEQSISRIDAGDYGYCDETGEPIGIGRLLARPTASLSLEAQQRRELKQKMFGD